MKGTDIEGIESFLNEMKEDIENNKIEKADGRRLWLLSLATVTDNKDLFVIEGILGTGIRRCGWIVEQLKSIMEGRMMEEKEADDLFGGAQGALIDMIIFSKDYLRHGDKTKFFDSIARDYYILQEITEMLRLEVGE